MALGDVYRLVRTVLIDGQTHVNVFHVLDSEGTSPTPEGDIMDAWDTSIDSTCPENKIRTMTRGYTTLVNVSLSCQRISPDKGEIVSRGIITDPTAALDSGLPTFAQTKFSIATDRHDRSGRGGFYVGGIPEENTEGNLVDTAYQVLQTALIDAIIAHFTPGGSAASGFTFGVWSQLLEEFNVVESISAAADIGTMRSRRLGRGV